MTKEEKFDNIMEGVETLSENSRKFIEENKEREFVGGLQCFTFVDKTSGQGAMAGTMTQFLGDGVAVNMAVADAIVKIYMEHYDDMPFEEFMSHMFNVATVLLEQKQGFGEVDPDATLN